MTDQPRVALCLFGQMRTYGRCYPYLKENVLDVLDPDVFVHTWQDRGGTWKTDGETDAGTVTESDLMERYAPVAAVIEQFNDEYYHRKDSVEVPEKVANVDSAVEFQKGMIPMFYKMHACNELKRSHEREEGFKYDHVILLRPDLVVLEPLPEEVLANPNVLWSAGNGFYYKIDDRFLVSSSSNIDYVTSIWGRLNHYWETELGDSSGELGVPDSYTVDDGVHIGTPERLLHYHLKQSDIATASHDVRCFILRQDSRVAYHTYLSPIRRLSLLAESGISTLQNEGLARFIFNTVRYLYNYARR